MSEHRVYRVTSIGRPVEPKYATNKAILVLMVIAAMIAGVVTALQGVGGGASARSALIAFLVVFACWALGREMAPDDNPAAFVGTVLAFISLWWWPSPSLLLLFTALLLARIVNRSTGLTARLGDSVIVTALVIWTMVGLQNPFAGVAGALAFLLDARLAEPNQRQWVFASVCLVAVIVHVLLTGSDNLGATWLPEPHYMIAGVTLLAFLAYSLSLRTVSSHGDVGGLVLNIERVRGGMLVVWLLTLQTSPQAQDAMQIVVPLLAVMAGVVLAGTANRLGIPTGKPTGLHL